MGIRFAGRLNYCGDCGKKIKDIQIKDSQLKVRYCKKCKIYLPEEAQYWTACKKEGTQTI